MAEIETCPFCGALPCDWVETPYPQTYALRAALQKAVDDYGKPGGPWNVPGDEGTWLAMARRALDLFASTQTNG